MSEPPAQFERIPLGTAAAGIAGSVVGAVMEAHAPGTGVLVGPVTEATLNNLAWRFDTRRRAKAVRAIEIAAEHAGTTPDVVGEAAVRDDARTELAAHALSAAANATYDEKVQALGRALADGLLGTDEAVADERMVVNALAVIDTPHLWVMEQLALGHPNVLRALDDGTAVTTYRRATVEAAVSALEAAGVVSRSAMAPMGLNNGDGFWLSALGRDCHKRITAAGEAAAS